MFRLDICFNVTFIQMLPNNGDPPQCALNECIHCDEDRSGPVFAAVAGRTRRASGLLSFILRPCAQLTILDHTDPCSCRPPPTPLSGRQSRNSGERCSSIISNLIMCTLFPNSSFGIAFMIFQILANQLGWFTIKNSFTRIGVFIP